MNVKAEELWQYKIQACRIHMKENCLISYKAKTVNVMINVLHFCAHLRSSRAVLCCGGSM
jgi:hypothetical protein